MDPKNINRLNQLFEKMVSNTSSYSEEIELTHLYSRFIDEGRNDSCNYHQNPNNQVVNLKHY